MEVGEVVEELAECWEATEGDLTETLASLFMDERDGMSRNCCPHPGDPFDDGPETDAVAAMTRWRASVDEDDQTPPFPAADVPALELAILARLILAERSTGGYAAAEFHPAPAISAKVSMEKRDYVCIMSDIEDVKRESRVRIHPRSVLRGPGSSRLAQPAFCLRCLSRETTASDMASRLQRNVAKNLNAKPRVSSPLAGPSTSYFNGSITSEESDSDDEEGEDSSSDSEEEDAEEEGDDSADEDDLESLLEAAKENARRREAAASAGKAASADLEFDNELLAAYVCLTGLSD